MVLTKQEMEQRIVELQQGDLDLRKELDAYYDQALAYIKSHLEAFYLHYAEEDGLSISQVTQNISQWDKRQWKEAIDELDVSGWLPESKQRAKILGNTAGLNLGNLISAIAGLGIIAWLDKSIQRTQSKAKQIAVDERRFLRSNTLATKRTDKNKQVLPALSSNIWLEGDRVLDEVRGQLFRAYQTGKGLDELRAFLTQQVKANPVSNIADRMYQTQSKIDRLIRSESAKMIDELDTETYIKNKIKWVDWITEPGACKICVGIQLGNPYRVEDAPKLVVDSHPNCRCAKVPSKGPQDSLTTKDKAFIAGVVAGAESNIGKSDEKDTAKTSKEISEEDTKEYEEILSVLGKEMTPKSLEKFQVMKYNDVEKYKELRDRFIWKQAKFPTQKSFNGHFKKHAKEFEEELTKEQYQEMAADLLSQPVSESILGYETEFRRVRYDKKNNMFVLGDNNKKTITTLLRPIEGSKYYETDWQREFGDN
ncbi:structural protein [Ligilactobacillus agilis]|uniref:hypothetical protein n=1 Tax=Ligilactobacillus agilis TaxID=1601 RepID=UPI001CDAE3A0|nr:hypothetical protein [Ligilactobacillus agilis]